jgi:bacterioferritin-associated ferredoxin
MAVDRCVCLDISFDELKKRAEEGSLNVEQLRRDTGCGGGCGLCVPYIHVMLKTGDTSLPVMRPAEFRSILCKPTISITRT